MSSSNSIAQLSGNDPNKIVIFPLGIPGFEKYTNYVVYHKQENNLSAYWLESCEDPSVTFTLVDPLQYGLNYEFELTDGEKEILEAVSADDLAVFMMLSKKEGEGDGEPNFHANLGGPVIINPESRRGLQKVLHGVQPDPDE